MRDLVHPTLAEHAEAIRSLGKRVITDIIEIGRRLTEAKKLVGHGRWGAWLRKEFGWSERTAQNFMRVHDLALSKSAKFANLRIAPSALYMLTAPSTPEPVREAALKRAEAGERITVEGVKATVRAEKVAAPPVLQKVGAVRYATVEETQAVISAGRRELAKIGPPSVKRLTANELIDALVESDVKIRKWAVEALVSGTRQSEFEAVREAVADLYRLLSRVAQ